MNNETAKYTTDRLIRLLFSAGGLFLFFYLLHTLRGVLIPFGIAVLLAYLLNPGVSFLERKTGKRGISVFIVLISSLLAISGTLWFLIPLLLEETQAMAQTLSVFIQEKEMAQKIQSYIPKEVWFSLQSYLQEHKVLEILQEERVINHIQSLVSKVLPGAYSVLSGTMHLLLSILGSFMILLYLIFMLMDYSRFKEEIKILIPERYQNHTFSFAKDFDKYMSQYFRAQSLVAFLVGVLFSIGFTIIGLPMGIFLGLLTGLLNMIPYLQLAAIIPAAFLAIIGAINQGESVAYMLIATAAVFAVVQVIQDAVIVPRFMGEITGLSPAMILLSISVWGELMGFFGLLVAIPFTCLFLAYSHQIQEKLHLSKQEKTTSPPSP
jgi:predicted PurR-regulated permease PerM